MPPTKKQCITRKRLALQLLNRQHDYTQTHRYSWCQETDEHLMEVNEGGTHTHQTKFYLFGDNTSFPMAKRLVWQGNMDVQVCVWFWCQTKALYWWMKHSETAHTLVLGSKTWKTSVNMALWPGPNTLRLQLMYLLLSDSVCYYMVTWNSGNKI